MAQKVPFSHRTSTVLPRRCGDRPGGWQLPARVTTARHSAARVTAAVTQCVSVTAACHCSQQLVVRVIPGDRGPPHLPRAALVIKAGGCVHPVPLSQSSL